MKRFVIDTMGATAPEFVAGALARHPHVSVLPGLAFVRDGLRLYRPQRLQDLSGEGVFDRLWAPSFEPGGRMWAGVTRRFSAEERTHLDLTAARRAFAADWSPTAGYVETLFLFASHVAPAVGAWKTHTRALGFCGAPFLRSLGWRELIERDITVLSAEVPLPMWLALASQRSIVNCLDALHGWIVHHVLVEVARRRGVRVHSVRSTRVASEGAEAATLAALGLDTSLPMLAEPGPGHAVFRAPELAPTEALAATLDEMFAGDPMYAAAARVAEWTPLAATADHVQSLVDVYVEYWNSTAHIHFDTVGPLEQEIVRVALAVSGLDAGSDRRTFARRFAQSFFHERIRFRSYTFETPSVDIDVSLGCLEDAVVLPRAPYFVHAALAYLERIQSFQKKWFDSYRPLAESSLFRTLESEVFTPLTADPRLRDRLSALQKTDAEIRLAAEERAANPGIPATNR